MRIVDIGIQHFRMLAFLTILGRLTGPFFLVLVIIGPVECADWRGITPLRSTRTDVERQLGRPRTNRPDFAVYDYDTERVSIEYSTGPCNVELSVWNVPRDTVISISVIPTGGLMNLPDQLSNQTAFRKVRDEHREEYVHYINDKEGIEYTVDEKNRIAALIRYFPPASDIPLKCPEPANRLREPFKVGEYPSSNRSARNRLLDRFARELIRYTSTNYASAEGYILAYDGRMTPHGVAIKAAYRAKDYVVRKWGLDPRRIQTLNAGSRAKSTVELYVTPSGYGPPRRLQ